MRASSSKCMAQAQAQAPLACSIMCTQPHYHRQAPDNPLPLTRIAHVQAKPHDHCEADHHADALPHCDRT